MEGKYDGMYNLKNHLYHLNQEELEEVYLYNKTCYLEFLVSLDQLLDYDTYSIFVIKNAKEMILNLMMKYREKSDLKETVFTENTNIVIRKINIASSQLEQEKLEEYIELQKNYRCLRDERYIPSMLAFDAEVIDGLENNKLDELDGPEYVLSSLNYLLYFYNGIYQHKDHIKTTIDYLKKNKRGNGLVYYKNAKRIIKELEEQYQEL